MIHLLNYDGICESFINSYIREFGERKFRTVLDKVMTSNKISGLISTSRYRMVAPDPKTFLHCINEIPYFIFSRGQTQALAGLLALTRWNDEVNDELHLVGWDDLKMMALSIIHESKATFI